MGSIPAESTEKDARISHRMSAVTQEEERAGKAGALFCLQLRMKHFTITLQLFTISI